MDLIIYKGIKFILNIKKNNLEKNKLYILDNPEIRELENYTIPIVKLEDTLFSKVLYSDHEIKCYKKLENLNITPRLVGVSSLQNCKIVILEKMEPLRRDYVNYSIILSLIDKIKLMHKNGIVHRDIKMNNLLYKDGDVYLCDFEDKGYSEQWASPEVLEDFENVKDPKSDIYSLGCTIYEMITGKEPWEGDDDFEEKVSNRDFSKIYENVKDPKIKEIIINCIEKRII